MLPKDIRKETARRKREEKEIEQTEKVRLCCVACIVIYLLGIRGREAKLNMSSYVGKCRKIPNEPPSNKRYTLDHMLGYFYFFTFLALSCLKIARFSFCEKLL